MTEVAELLIKKLRWQCRRGMKEMDALLLRFLDRNYAGATPELRGAFEMLLQTEDDVLWRWISGRVACEHDKLREVIDVILATEH